VTSNTWGIAELKIKADLPGVSVKVLQKRRQGEKKAYTAR